MDGLLGQRTGRAAGAAGSAAARVPSGGLLSESDSSVEGEARSRSTERFKLERKAAKKLQKEEKVKAAAEAALAAGAAAAGY